MLPEWLFYTHYKEVNIFYQLEFYTWIIIAGNDTY